MMNKTTEGLNLLVINQVAAIKLRLAGVAVDSVQLHVFQLMRWGLDAGVPLTHKRTAAELERLCRASTPDRALDYFLDKVPGGMAALHKRLLRLSPRAAAQFLLEVLDMRLKADPFNSYPSQDI